MYSFAMRFRSFALASALALMSAASPALAQDGAELVGHWRKTTIVFESPRDEHLILYPNSTYENWT